MKKKYKVYFEVYGDVTIEANSTHEARMEFKNNWTPEDLSKHLNWDRVHIVESYSEDRYYLERLYNKAKEEDYQDRSATYQLAACMDDPLFVSTIDQLKAGDKPGDAELLDIIADICFSLLLYFSYTDESNPREYAIKQKAIEAALAMKPLCPEFPWGSLPESCWE